MTTHHTSLYDDKENMAPKMVLKQVLLTMEQTENGVRISELHRRFSANKKSDSYLSEPIVLNFEGPSWPK